MGDRQIVMVIGPPRSGTSCVAGVLAKLGLPMGDTWQKNSGNPKGYFEDRPLKRIHEASMGEIWEPERKNSFEARVGMLREWAAKRHAKDGDLIGGKYPHLMCMVPEMCEAFGDSWRAIATMRPAIDSARSMKRLRHMTVERKRDGIQKAIGVRDRELVERGVKTLYVPYPGIVMLPHYWVTTLCRFAGLPRRKGKIAAAIDHIDPKLNHHSR